MPWLRPGPPRWIKEMDPRVSSSLEDKNPGEPPEVRPEDDTEGHDSQIDRLKRKSNRSTLDSG